MGPNAFALGFIVGIVCTLALIAATTWLDTTRFRARPGGYQPPGPATPGTPPSGPAGASQRP